MEKRIFLLIVLFLGGCYGLEEPLATGTYQCVNSLYEREATFQVLPTSEITYDLADKKLIVDGTTFDSNWACRVIEPDGGHVDTVTICTGWVCYGARAD